jgi:sigma-54 dependent transcriptional regulator, acetoin dehydrogenase operon transcriptional activator AcoR
MKPSLATSAAPSSIHKQVGPHPINGADAAGRALATLRQDWLMQGSLPADAAITPWIGRSWQRCLDQGMRPDQKLAFNSVSNASIKRVQNEGRNLVQAAQPILNSLDVTLKRTRYFAILTNQAGVVVAAHGPIDAQDPRAGRITRVGVDLSEQAVGTTAIGAALLEQRTIWLHRGEHFFNDTAIYSCAGTALFGPLGNCIGMLDLTGIDAQERPELRHLVSQSARRIENRMVLEQASNLVLHFNWPGQPLLALDDALVCLDANGCITGFNTYARQVLGLDQQHSAPGSAGQGRAHNPLHNRHADEFFAVPTAQLFDAANAAVPTLRLPLWSGLSVDAIAFKRDHYELVRSRLAGIHPSGLGLSTTHGLKELESGLIREAVRQAKGNVAQAAKALGISRATIYRKLGQPPG